MVAQSVVAYPLHSMCQIAFLLMEKRLPIRHKKLKVSELRPVYGGVVELSDDALPQSKPKVTGG